MCGIFNQREQIQSLRFTQYDLNAIRHTRITGQELNGMHTETIIRTDKVSQTEYDNACRCCSVAAQEAFFRLRVAHQRPMRLGSDSRMISCSRACCSRNS